MGKEKDKALGRKVHNRDILRIDELVFTLKNGTRDEAYEAQKAILEYFDSYLEKYVNLFMGLQADLWTYDTRLFIGMFLTNRAKSQENLQHQRAYITKVMGRFTRDDIKNELTVIFLTVLAKHRIYAGVNALNPLTKLFRFRVKDWFNRIVRDPLFKTAEASPSDDGPSGGEPLIDYSVARDYSDDLLTKNFFDLDWVHCPSEPLYWDLTRYERYLIHLTFSQELTVAEIASKLERDKETIRQHLSVAKARVEELLREEYGE